MLFLHPRQSPSIPFAPRAAALLGMLIIGFSFGTGRNRTGAVPGDTISRLQAVQPDSSRARVLIMATFHLRQIADAFKPALLDSLAARLAGFHPDSICVETLPGVRVRELDLQRDAGPLYSDLLDSFAARHLKMGKPARSVLRTTPQAAALKVRELLAAARAASPRKMTPVERTALALWMLAAYEPESAALQWSYLNEEDKRAQKAVPPELARELDAELARVNEVPALAIRVARTLGLENLDPVDDFEDLEAYAEIDSELDKDIKGSSVLAAVPKAAVYAEAAARLEGCIRRGNLLPQFSYLNSAAYAAADVDAQWGVFLRTHFASGSDRSRLGLWENRNLKIAARIRAVAALHPGGRILVIYGAAHKPFLEAYLSKTADVQLVRFEELEAK